MSETKIRVILSGSFPDKMNSNLVLRSYLKEGVAACIGSGSVLDVPLEILPQTVRNHGPELVICFGSCPPEVTNYAPLRAACSDSGAHLAFWLHDDPYEFDLNDPAARVADTLVSNDRWSVLHYQHPRVFHLPLAASTQVHYRPWQSHKDRDVFFCGVAFENRVRLLQDLAPVCLEYKTEVFGDGWPETLRFAFNQRIPNTALADMCAGSLVTLYMGRNYNIANRRYQLDPSTPGPRLFEAAMTGTVQLMFADSLEVLDYFTEGEGVLLYDAPSDLKQKLEHLKDDSTFARKVAEDGQRRAMAAHTYTHRAASLLRICGLSCE